MRNFSCSFLAVTAVLSTAGITPLALGQVANDECTGAVVLTSAVAQAFDNTSATPSADALPTCAVDANNFGWGAPTRDVWFKWTSGATSGLIDISTCLASGKDTSIVVYTGVCGALTQVACNGDGTGLTGCQAFYSLLNDFRVDPATDYFIRLGGYDDTTASIGPGSITLTFTETVPGCPSVGSCRTVRATPGCEDIICCNAVCAVNPPCCDTAWDQSCVDATAGACGYYFYTCGTANPLVANDCAPAATNVLGDSVIPFNLDGCSDDGPDDPTNVCQSANLVFFGSVWYKVKALGNGTLRAYTCGVTTFDTKIAIYNLGTGDPSTFNYDNLPDALIACNDYVPCTGNGDGFDPSDVSVTASLNNWYLIRLASFQVVPGQTGNITIDVPELCPLPANTGLETEACGAASNNGCNGGGEYQDIAIGDSIKGTFSSSTTSRDVDFYRVFVPADSSVTMKVYSASNVAAGFYTGSILPSGNTANQCSGLSQVAIVSGNCPTQATACLNPGTYYISVAPAAVNGQFQTLPCGSGQFNDYLLEVTSTPSNCPDVIDQVCALPGPDTTSTSVPQASTGNFTQGCATGCGNFSGGNTSNMWATSFSGANLLTSMSCVNFGVASLVTANDTATPPVCGYYGSNLPLPAKVRIYRDLNGGSPTNVTADGGLDGGDLQLITERDILVPGGVYMANVDFDPPLCLSGETTVVVAVMSYDLFAGGTNPGGIPVNSGYRLGLGIAVQTGLTYTNAWLRILTNCATSAASVSFQPIGFNAAGAIAYHWPVQMNGVAAQCPAACPTDLNGDNVTNSADLSVLLNGWGSTSPDLNGDGIVGSADLSVLLNGWGACP